MAKKREEEKGYLDYLPNSPILKLLEQESVSPEELWDLNPSKDIVENPPKGYEKNPQMLNIFSSQEMRDRADADNVLTFGIDLDDIEDFRLEWDDGEQKEHIVRYQSFKVNEDDPDMQDLIRSIRDVGQLQPGIVRKVGRNKYMLLGGHRRAYALRKAGVKKMLCRIIDPCDDELATKIMAADNARRKDIKPSEKAWTYRMLLEQKQRSEKYIRGTKHGRGSEGQARDEIASLYGDTGRWVTELIRLTYLIPSMLTLVDDKFLGLKQGAALSSLPEAYQKALYHLIVDERFRTKTDRKLMVGINMKQAKELIAASQKAVDARDFAKRASDILEKKKPNQEKALQLTYSDLVGYYTEQDLSKRRGSQAAKDEIINALALYREIEEAIKKSVLAGKLKSSTFPYEVITGIAMDAIKEAIQKEHTHG